MDPVQFVQSGMHGTLACEQDHRYIMLYGNLYSASHRTLLRGALSVTGRRKEKSSNNEETQMISLIASHSVVQEQSHSRMQDPKEQRTDSGIDQY